MHVVVLHVAADAGSAGAVAAVLGDFNVYTLEIAPGKLPLRFGPHVVPLLIWTPNIAGDELLETIATTLSRTGGRCIVFGLQGVVIPERFRSLAHACLDQTRDGEGDTARLREAIARVAPATTGGAVSAAAMVASDNGRGAMSFVWGLLLGCALGAGGALAVQQVLGGATDLNSNVAAPSMPDRFGDSAARANPVSGVSPEDPPDATVAPETQAASPPDRASTDQPARASPGAPTHAQAGTGAHDLPVSVPSESRATPAP